MKQKTWLKQVGAQGAPATFRDAQSPSAQKDRVRRKLQPCQSTSLAPTSRVWDI